MALYVRKSVSVGPFRFNISKSGAGVSVGTRGLRVGTGPRGNYIHMGRGGLYYRTTLPISPNQHNKRPDYQPSPSSYDASSDVEMTEIDSADTSTIVDSTSAELVSELNKKRSMIPYWPIAAIISLGTSLYLANNSIIPESLFLGILVFSALATLAAFYLDKLRKTTVLMYDLEDEAAQEYQHLLEAFSTLSNCGGKWHISASGNVCDKKYHAGASVLVERKPIAISSSEPPYVKSNLSAPCIPVGKQKLYFFPDKVLVFEPRGVGAVSYNDLVIKYSTRDFVEDGRVPKDAEVVGSTWQYVNKKGGPDKRFKDNRQIPVARYEEISLTSDTGLNELIQISNVGTGQIVAKSIADLARFTL